MKNFLVKGIAAGIAILAVSLVFDFLVMQIWPYDIFSLGGMRSSTDPLMTLFFLQPFVLGVILAYVYKYFSLKGNYVRKGKTFGLLMWGVYGVTSTFITFTSMNYPAGFYVSSLFGSLLYMLAAGFVIAKLS